MYPTNHYMDPYSSYYRHHAPYPYYPPPAWEAGRQGMPDADCSPCRPPYGPWPYSGSMNHSGLPESHSCCSHTYPPGYYSFRPPFPQELPPPYPYYHGPFPPHHPNPYSSSYFGPFPPYPVDQTAYNGLYDKFKSHCCGCPNHVCHGDGGQKSNVKIEEHVPEVKDDSKHKDADNSRIIRNPNYQYPVMWLPSGDKKDKANNGTSFEFPPQFFSKWFPQSGERTEDVKPADDSQKAKQHQWPMVWMPPGYGVETKPEAKKELKETEQSPKNTQEDPPSPKIKIIPLSWFGNDHHDQKPAARDGSGEQNGRSSAVNQPACTEHRHDTTADGNCKTIPVVPEKPSSGNKPAISVVPEKSNSGDERAISVVPEKQDVEKKVHTCRTIPVMAQKESDEKKSCMAGNKEEKKAIMVQKEGENKKSNNAESSKAKPSKLPPVCLRVDPLPKKKSGNTSSRSSSPATRKVSEKEAQGKNQETKLSEHQKEGKMPIKEKSSDEIATNTGPRNVTVLDASVKHAQEEQVSTSVADQKVQPTVSAEAQEKVSAKSLQECDKNRKEDEYKIRGEAPNLALEIKLSEPDAAVRIQSAYRGYHVRRWQPLEKLRKIKNVHMQMQDVEKQLQALEASSKQPTEKEHVAINETIMNLLLNLDTIQGLHPVVRESRKSVARQLVCLQEKLDSLCKKMSAEPNHPKSEEESLIGVQEEQLPSSVNSNEPMHDDVSSEVALKFNEDGDSTEQKHQMEELSTANEEAQDKGKAAAPTECQGVRAMDVMPDAALSGLITEKKHQIEEPGILREECTEEQEKAAEKGEESSTHHIEPLHYTLAEQNCHTEKSDQGFSPTTTEDGTTAMTAACTDSEVAVKKDGLVEGGGQVQESASIGSSRRKHDAAPAEDQCNVPSAPSLHLEDSEVADPHGNDPPLADDSIIVNAGDQQAEVINADMEKEVEDAKVDSGKELDGTPFADTGNLDYDTGANAENTTQENVVLVGSEEATKQCEVSHMDDSALMEQQNECGSAILEKTESVPFEVQGKPMETFLNDGIGEGPEAAPLESRVRTMENTLNDAIGEEAEDAALESRVGTMENTLDDAIGEEPEAVPVENRGKTMESTLKDAGSLPSNGSAEPEPEPALPESATNGPPPCEHDGGALHGDSADSEVSSGSQGDLQKEQDGDDASETTEGNVIATKPAETLACAAGVNSAVPVAAPEAEMPEEGAEGASPEEEEAAATTSAAHDNGPKGGDDAKNKGLDDENQKLKEMLQKVLASGNDQMGVIAELSDKVKSLERKLARKRRPKVRVQHRPARNATANDVL
ncbi:BAG family molecular chaperone regulator 6 isoform X1 [Triticum urartu]|uniref:BAG domain-containing protein n=1 Tax=Triticum urartu TaxID=4572 RepID=A0A8R7UPD0_TRIUA|nr:BAG family molecular chaperone regulator 6 isoform X1 [Triticum urartu]